MHLTTIDIKNFRSLKELHVDLQVGFNVLVGRNNTGKTNLLHAIRHAIGPAASYGDSLWLDRDDFYRASAADDPESTISITLTFTDLDELQRAHFFEIVDFDLTDLAKSKAVIRFEATWPKDKKHATVKRTGGPSIPDAPEVPTALLQSLPVTFLPALRDAEAALAPGYRSRLALLLRDKVARAGDDTRQDIIDIFGTANKDLLELDVIETTTSSLKSRTDEIAGTDAVPSSITAADVDFDKILRTLQVQMKDSPIASLSANGLGFNNLLYMAVILEHLKQEEADECPLLLVEEPEAHLHPQLTLLLADYLAKETPGVGRPQTIVTTHSPALAAAVPPNQIHVLFTGADSTLRCNCLAQAQMTNVEQRSLQRMMDVTRATLYFAKGIILVEGICEALIVPVLAKRLGYDFRKEHISVVPICGVAFGIFRKIFSDTALGIPVAIVSDADPKVTRGETWKTDTAEMDGTGFVLSDRMTKLLGQFQDQISVQVFHSKLTLEYDLAEAGNGNAAVMATVWESCFIGTPGTFNSTKVIAIDEVSEKALAAWRGICRAEHSGSKADFAQQLAIELSEVDDAGVYRTAFETPDYIKNAIEFVLGQVRQAAAQ